MNWEGLRLTAYPDQGGTWTIGYGHTPSFEGQTITDSQATQLLFADLVHVETGISCMVTSPLTNNQFSALCSLVYNIGLGEFKTSTCLKYLNEKNYLHAANWFLPFCKIHGVGDAGLLNRRVAEMDLFNTPDET